MPTYYISELDRKRAVYCVTDVKGSRFSVSAMNGECNCAKGKKTRSCRHLEALQRYCKRHGLSFGPTDICPACDGITGLLVPCGVCAGRGRLPAAEARALRHSKWGGRTEAENVALLRLWGEKTERDIPKTRIRFRAADDEAQAA